MPPRELTCVLVEDQGLFLDMFAEMLNMRGGLRVVAGAHSVAEGKAACKRHSPDLLVLDLALPDGDGLDVAAYLLRRNPSARVVIVSGNVSDFICPEWLRSNLQATIDKTATFTDLNAEIAEILATAGVREPRAETGKPPARHLSAREAAIFALIGDGLGTKEIAARLGISEHTVKTHRKNIARKLDTEGLELVRKASERRSAFRQGGP